MAAIDFFNKCEKSLRDFLFICSQAQLEDVDELRLMCLHMK